MKFSTRARYGLRAMVELAINYNPNEPVPLSDIAEKQGISEGYLEQLMTFLRKGGLVRSVRGSQGGYILNREPKDITAGDVVRCLEGPLAPTNCVAEEDSEICERAGLCATKDLWTRIRNAIARELDTTSLEDLRQEFQKLQESGQDYCYYI
ncbi:MAG: Rrf2 family transcriptional regulator [Desulfitibacter sp. BRH_c19]|nr:MAG: Rrf2 family transcriptional regulator [Desulfitibacter sp. BRH_c19]